MENSTPQFKSSDTRDYSRKVSIAEILDMKKAIELRKQLAAQYWADFARVS